MSAQSNLERERLELLDAIAINQRIFEEVRELYLGVLARREQLHAQLAALEQVPA